MATTKKEKKYKNKPVNLGGVGSVVGGMVGGPLGSLIGRIGAENKDAIGGAAKSVAQGLLAKSKPVLSAVDTAIGAAATKVNAPATPAPTETRPPSGEQKKPSWLDERYKPNYNTPIGPMITVDGRDSEKPLGRGDKLPPMARTIAPDTSRTLAKNMIERQKRLEERKRFAMDMEINLADPSKMTPEERRGLYERGQSLGLTPKQIKTYTKNYLSQNKPNNKPDETPTPPLADKPQTPPTTPTPTPPPTSNEPIGFETPAIDPNQGAVELSSLPPSANTENKTGAKKKKRKVNANSQQTSSASPSVRQTVVDLSRLFGGGPRYGVMG